MLINNAVHDSVGGQPTGLGHVFFEGLIKFDAHMMPHRMCDCHVMQDLSKLIFLALQEHAAIKRHDMHDGLWVCHLTMLFARNSMRNV